MTRGAVFLLLTGMLLLAVDPAARNVKSVYILKMTGGLDQYLASELSKNGVFSVTTDPNQADAIFTDSLGEGFEKKYKALYEPPPVETDKKEEGQGGITDASPPRIGSSSWSRGRGTIFLVDRKTRSLLWSMNRQPKNSAPAEMVTQARKVVAQLKKDLNPSASQ